MNTEDKTYTNDTQATEIEPVEIAVLLSLIFDGMSQIRPDLKMILEQKGVCQEQFSHDVSTLVTTMITTTPQASWKSEGSVS
jgi:hypothetical protein